MSRQGQAYVLSEEEHKDFLAFIGSKKHSERNKAIYLLTRRAMLRIGEVAKLKLSDVVKKNGEMKEVITLRSDVTKGKKIRTAFINHPELQEALVKYLSGRPKYKSDYLFVSQKMTSFSPNSMARVMNKMYQEAGYDGASSHSGRRGGASALLKNGLDIVSLSKVLGHSSTSTTALYIQVDQDSLMSAVATS